MVSQYKWMTLYVVFMSPLSLFQSRYSCKLFDATQSVAEQDIETLIETARLAPSALGISVVRLVRVKDTAVRTELRKHSFHQTQITDASTLFVFAVKTGFTQSDIDEHITLTAEKRNIEPSSLGEHRKLIEQVLSSFSQNDLVEWFSKQAYIALGFVLTQCAALGIDACPIGLIDAAKYDEILNLESSGLHTSIVLTVGYRSAQDVCQTFPKVRIDREHFLLPVS